MTLSKANLLQQQDRTISYRKLGNGSRKILFFHGFPGSSAQIFPFQEFVESLDLEVLCLDRPGYNKTSPGNTEPFKQSNLDILTLTEELQWKQFEVISVSGGTPYLFSFLKDHSALASKVSIISGLGPICLPPFKRILPIKAQVSLFFLPTMPDIIFQLLLKKPQLIRLFLKPSSSDLGVLRKIENLKILETALHEAFLQNGIGPKQDAKAFLSNWNLSVESLPSDISIWHGGEDQIIPVDMAKQLSALLTKARLFILPTEGHYSLAFNFIRKILVE